MLQTTSQLLPLAATIVNLRAKVQVGIFALWGATLGATTLIYLLVKDPALLAERAKGVFVRGQPLWDKVFLLALTAVVIPMALVIRLDVGRFHWSPSLPLAIDVLGGLLLLPSFFFIFRSLADNPFASSVVRIQAERNQRVVSTGIYGVVRHPMYLGAILGLVGAPLLLGSLYGLALGFLVIALLMARIVGEERFLIKKLEGYAEYRQKVRYRLLPGVW